MFLDRLVIKLKHYSCLTLKTSNQRFTEFCHMTMGVRFIEPLIDDDIVNDIVDDIVDHTGVIAMPLYVDVKSI